MTRIPVKELFSSIDFGKSIRLLRKEELLKRYACNVLSRFQWSKAEGDKLKGKNTLENGIEGFDSGMSNCSSSEDELGNTVNYKWKPEIAWLGKALEPALQLYKWAVPLGNRIDGKPPPTDISIADIFSSIQKSKLGIQDWSLSDLTIGLYLLYLRQASKNDVEEVKGELISSESIVQELIYHLELAKGSYKDNARGLARYSMLQEKNVVKFVKNSSVLRPGYYIGVDMRKKLVILCIRGTHTVYDLITDIISSGHEEITFEGYSAHFGTAEAARWFLNHEMETIKMCLEKYKGFRLRLVGHSLGGATASLLAIMLHNKSSKELGFNPETITAVGFGTPPCVCKELAEGCSDFVTTVAMQDDIIPRLCVASLTRLRNEIVETDWVSVLSKEDWKGVVDLVTNAKQVVSSVQDVARKISEYAKFKGETEDREIAVPKEVPIGTVKPKQSGSKLGEDLFVPGLLYFLKRNVDPEIQHKQIEYFTLLKRHRDEEFQRIQLSSNLISDHKCDSHYYALRDVVKGLPVCLDKSEK